MPCIQDANRLRGTQATNRVPRSGEEVSQIASQVANRHANTTSALFRRRVPANRMATSRSSDRAVEPVRANYCFPQQNTSRQHWQELTHMTSYTKERR